MKFAGPVDLRDLMFLALNKFSLRFLSPRGEERLEGFIGDIAYTFLKSRRLRVANHISAVLGSELAPYQVWRLTRGVFRNKRVENFSLSVISRKSIRNGIIIEGLENLEEALSRGRGAILWESPFGNRFLAKAALADKGFQLCQVHYRGHGGSPTWFGQRIIRGIDRRAESNIFSEIVEIQDDTLAYLRLMIGRLKQNGIICISGIGSDGHKFVPVELLGMKRYIATGIVSLARMTDASTIPMFCYRNGSGADRLVLEKPIHLADGGDRDEVLIQGVTQYVGLLESYIRRHPDQWYQWGW